MAEVIDITSKLPHLSGNALCLTCGHKWVAVAPIGTTEFECPECGTFKGVTCGLTCPDTILECECGNQHFYIDPDSPLCSRCGVRVDNY